VRHSFTKSVIATLAKRAGYRCSNPACRKQTVGPHPSPDKALDIGVAVHITADSPGGMRYDPTLTQEERKGIQNAIWLCHNCATIVDRDAAQYHTEMLMGWKNSAEQWDDSGKLQSDSQVASEARPVEHVVLLIHGIRTEADWQEMVVQQLTSPQVRVFPIKYGFFDAFQFLLPGPTRKGPMQKVLKEIRIVRDRFPTAKLSIIAHSFGTHVVSQLLQNNFDIRLFRTLFCGAVVQRNYPWEKVLRQITEDQVVNECGKSDVWPVIAQSVTWGYGASGTHGFGGVVVRDRYHSGGHSQYFSPAFIAEFWTPFIRDGIIRPSRFEASRPNTPWWLSLLGWIPLRYVLALVVVLGFYRIGWQPLRELLHFANNQRVEVQHGAVELADVAFIDDLSGNIAPRLDIKLSNPSHYPAIVKRVDIQVRRIWNLRQLPTMTGAYLPPSHTYVQRLQPRGAPYQRTLNVSQAIGSNDTDRFLIQFEEESSEEEMFSANTVYYANVKVFADSDDKTIGSKDVLFLISYQGDTLPTSSDLQDLVDNEKRMGRQVTLQALKEAVAANRVMLQEIADIQAARSPSLQRMIDSMNSLPK
jgi:hypothetical protein